MADIIKIFIDKIFNSSNDDCQIDLDNISMLFSKYEDIDDQSKIISLKDFVGILPQLNIFDVKKWVLILSKLLTYSPKCGKKIEEIIEIFIPNSKENYTPTEILGRKLSLFVISNYLIPIINKIEIDLDAFSKLLYYLSQFVGDRIVGIIVSLVLSQYIKQLSSSEFHQMMNQIVQLIFTKNKDLRKCPQLYPILLSLKNEHMQILSEENFSLPNFKSEQALIKFIDIFKKLNNEAIIVYFNCFALSDLLKPFWDLLIDCLNSNKGGYCEKEVVLNCVVETIHPTNSSLIDLASPEEKFYILDIVWNNCSIWELFLSHLSDEKSLFQSLCKTTIAQLRIQSSSNSNRIVSHLFKYFLTIVDQKCHLMESNVPQNLRLSQCLISFVNDGNQLSKYIDLLMGFFLSQDLKDEEKVFIIEQIAYVCQCSLDTEIHNVAIDRIISIQTREIFRKNFLIEIVKRSSFSAVISSIHHSVSSRNLTMSEYLIYLKSIINIVIGNLRKESSKFKMPLKMFKSLSKYIDEQLKHKSVNDNVNAKVFPCFGSVICYLCLFLLSKIDLTECDKSLGKLDQIIDWIKQCFQAAHRSVELSNDEEIPRRKRMLSVSSLCSDDENEVAKSKKNCHWSFYLIDILLKIYDEDVTLMNDAVNSIVSLMIRTKTMEISGVRYVKNLILSDKARRKKLSELESVTQSDAVSKDFTVDLLKSRHLKERCLNILFTIISEDDDVDMIASCFFILLEICSTEDKILTNQIESRILLFKKKSKLSKDFYLNGDNVVRAIVSILTISNDSSNYDNFVEMAKNIIIGLVNRVNLNKDTIASLASMLENNFYGSISNFQKSILQAVFVEHVQLAWHMRDVIYKCIDKSDVLRLTKYKAFEIAKSLIYISESERSALPILKYGEFVLQMIPSVINVLSSFNFEALNAKYASIVLECLIGLIKVSPEMINLPSDLVSKLNILVEKKQCDLYRLICKFNEIYKNKSLILNMISLEKLQEYDQHISYLLKLLPAEFNKDLDHHVNNTKIEKQAKELKAVSKFKMINQASKSINTKLNNKKNSERKATPKKRPIEDVTHSIVDKKKLKIDGKLSNANDKKVNNIDGSSNPIEKEMAKKQKKQNTELNDNSKPKKEKKQSESMLQKSVIESKNIDNVPQENETHNSKKQKKSRKLSNNSVDLDSSIVSSKKVNEAPQANLDKSVKEESIKEKKKKNKNHQKVETGDVAPVKQEKKKKKKSKNSDQVEAMEVD